MVSDEMETDLGTLKRRNGIRSDLHLKLTVPFSSKRQKIQMKLKLKYPLTLSRK
jgi:hypothetical protein